MFNFEYNTTEMMYNALPKTITAKDKKIFLVLALCVLVFVLLTVVQDFLRSNLEQSAFYFSESFMFSSFWWIFAPLLFAQYLIIKQQKKRYFFFQATIIFLPLVVHLFAFPALVWALSKIFYYHTFSFWQTMRFTLSEHLYQLMILYTAPVLLYPLFIKKKMPRKKHLPTVKENEVSRFADTVLVTEGNKKMMVAVSEIVYIAASPPYISIHLEGKKYLYNETLKSIAQQLDPGQFVRVHKSAIVNITMVAAYTTRLNGDYDLTMKNNVTLRLSRNFVPAFKSLFSNTHRLTAK
jgi:LytTr DNA-binding domain